MPAERRGAGEGAQAAAGRDSLLAARCPLDSAARRRRARRSSGARVAFRDVTRATDSRTVVACLVPPEHFLTNTAPYLAFVDGAIRAPRPPAWR